jgi:hypothetical protein
MWPLTALVRDIIYQPLQAFLHPDFSLKHGAHIPVFAATILIKSLRIAQNWQ